MTQQETRISVKQAVHIARDYILELYDGQDLPNLMLEEVQMTDDDQHWLITFGFDTNRPTQIMNDPYSLPLQRIRSQYVREYKRITLSANTGDVVGMTIREI